MALEAFFKAIDDGDIPRLRELLPEVDVEDRVRALRYVIMEGKLDVARFFLTAGVPPEHDCCKNYMYPLHMAVRCDNPAAVALLLGAGAHPDVLHAEGLTPLFDVKSSEVAQLLFDAGADVNYPSSDVPPILYVALCGNAPGLRAILGHLGVDIHAKDSEGQTALHHAAMSAILRDSAAECTTTLLDAGLDPLVVDNSGMTPLAYLHYHATVFTNDITNPRAFKVITLLVAAGDYQWTYVPMPCPGLQKALVPVWEKAPEELPQLFQHLEPDVQAQLREAPRALHHGARPFDGLDEPLRVKILSMIFEP